VTSPDAARVHGCEEASSQQPRSQRRCLMPTRFSCRDESTHEERSMKLFISYDGPVRYPDPVSRFISRKTHGSTSASYFCEQKNIFSREDILASQMGGMFASSMRRKSSAICSTTHAEELSSSCLSVHTHPAFGFRVWLTHACRDTDVDSKSREPKKIPFFCL
jgi:hypothetical protein